MRFIMQPLIFYPLAILTAAAIILFGLAPQKWPRDPAPVAGEVQNGVLVLAADAFNSPSPIAEENLTVVRDFLGKPVALRVAVLPNQGGPAPRELGVRVMLTSESAALIAGRPVTVEVAYNPISPNAANSLAVALQGGAERQWVSQDLAAQSGVATYSLPAEATVDGIGFRAVSSNDDQAYGVEITSVRIVPRG